MSLVDYMARRQSYQQLELPFMDQGSQKPSYQQVVDRQPSYQQGGEGAEGAPPSGVLKVDLGRSGKPDEALS